MPGSLQILVSSFFVFGSLGCVIFFTMVSICKARHARLLKNVKKYFITSSAETNEKITYPFNKTTACILVKIITRIRCKVHVLYHGMGRANTTCWITYFWLWRYWLAIQLRNTVSNRSITSSSHVFTNPESTIFFTKFSLFCFLQVRVFFTKIDLTYCVKKLF